MNKVSSTLLSTLFLAVFLSLPAAACIQDDFVNSTLSKSVKAPEIYPVCDFTSTDTFPIPLSITAGFKSEKELFEGQNLSFKVRKNVYYKGKLYLKANTPVKARVETITTNGMNGFPASVTIGDFKVPGLEQYKLTPTYEKFGHDYSLFVFPLKWALTILPPTGSLTNFIKGGHTHLTPKNKIIIYYHPEWKCNSSRI